MSAHHYTCRCPNCVASIVENADKAQAQTLRLLEQLDRIRRDVAQTKTDATSLLDVLEGRIKVMAEPGPKDLARLLREIAESRSGTSSALDRLADRIGALIGTGPDFRPIPQAPPKKLRGFAAMPPEKRLAIAAKGGQTARDRGTAHKFTPDTASAAGKVGGKHWAERPEHMATIGGEGGRRKKGSKHRKGREETPAT